MKTMFQVAVTVMAVVLLTLSAAAGEGAADKVSIAKLEPGSGSGQAGGDEQLDARKSDFVRFAQAKLTEMNRNHRLSRSRMQIDKSPDGSYRAKYHQIDETTMACEVNRSKSKSIPYVAVLSYREHVYEASCPTPDACKQGHFTAVSMIPNRQIFSYSNGVWK
jgi:hypothetical protein